MIHPSTHLKPPQNQPKTLENFSWTCAFGLVELNDGASPPGGWESSGPHTHPLSKHPRGEWTMISDSMRSVHRHHTGWWWLMSTLSGKAGREATLDLTPTTNDKKGTQGTTISSCNNLQCETSCPQKRGICNFGGFL